MAKKAPADQPAVVSLERERERTIALLSEHFAQDNLTLDELERRMEATYRAASVAALRELTRDLVGETAPPAAAGAAPVVAAKPGVLTEPLSLDYERIVSVMSETKRTGVWHAPRQLDAWCVMSETTLDLRRALLQPGVTEIRLRALMAQVKVVVSPGVRVVLQPSAFMASVSDETVDPPAVGSGAPVVRITGRAIMAELRAVTAPRELESGEDDD